VESRKNILLVSALVIPPKVGVFQLGLCKSIRVYWSSSWGGGAEKSEVGFNPHTFPTFFIYAKK